MYSTFERDEARSASGLKRLARRDLPTTPRVPPTQAPDRGQTDRPFVWPEVTLVGALTWLRGGLVWIAILAALGAAAGYAYASLSTPKYSAATDMIVDPSSLQVVQDNLFKNPLDQSAQLLDVESKLRVLTSGSVLTRVVKTLNLQDDPEFTEPRGMFDALAGNAGTSADDPVQTAVGILEKKVAAWREERSYVVTVMVSTSDPNKSVTIANTIVAAFQAELAQAETDGATRAAASLMGRLAELQTGVTAAENAVEAFKRAHNLQTASGGELVNSQSMTQINKNALDAQQALLAAQSRYAELTDPVTGKANADAVQTDTMVALRTQYGLLRQTVDAAATTLGPLHPTRAAAERQLAGLQAQITAEANRAVQSAKLELDQATRTLVGVNQQNDAARSTVSSDDAAQVQLNTLERDAKAKSDVYEAFLTRARQVTEQQQVDSTNIRVISPATPPSTRSWPPRGVTVAGLGAMGGGGLGCALALALGWFGAARRLRKQS